MNSLTGLKTAIQTNKKADINQVICAEAPDGQKTWICWKIVRHSKDKKYVPPKNLSLN